MQEGLLCLAQPVSDNVGVESRVFVRAEIGPAERLYRIAVIMTLLLLDLNDLEHGDEHAAEKDARNEWLKRVEDVGTRASAVAAEDEEGQDQENNNEHGQIRNIVDKAKVIEVQVKHRQGILAVHDIAIALELPRNRRPHPKLLGIESAG